MATTTQVKPKPQEGIDDGVSIQVSIADGYTGTQPPTTTVTSGDHGTTRKLGFCWYCRSLLCFACVMIIALSPFILLATLDLMNNFPRFKLESVSVSIGEIESQAVTAAWDLGFSIKNRNRMNSFEYKDFSVWIRCMSRNWSVKDVRLFVQHVGKTVILNATVDTRLPRDYVVRGLMKGGLTLQYEVMFQVIFEAGSTEHAMKAMCKNLTVEISSGSEGIMMGLPRLCPRDHYTDV